MMPKLKKNSVKVKKSSKSSVREVKYDAVVLDVCSGETAITADDAKELLGWETADDGPYIRELWALAKVKARCSNNVTNRPIYPARVKQLKQEILRRRWRLNGEPVIVGKTGLVLNGQHCLLALILANLEWEAEKDHWSEYWKTPPTIDKTVVSGIDEDDETVNTMDTCKPRSLMDVLYRTEGFANMPEKQRRVTAGIADYAIRLLWHRTAAGLDAFSTKRTHAESLDFLSRHPKLLEAVKHVYEEENEHSLSRYTSLGCMAGLLYLMGCSGTDPAEYRKANHPDESMLDFGNWDKACDFMVKLSAGGKDIDALRAVMAETLSTVGAIGRAERWGLLVNAWLAYEADEPITTESLELSYASNKDGVRQLVDHPSVGGIDVGDPSTVDEEAIMAQDPKPEEIARATKAIQDDKSNKAKKEAKPQKKQLVLGKPRKSGKSWGKGDVAWVHSRDEEPYLGRLIETPVKCADGSHLVMVETTTGEQWEVRCADLGLQRRKTGTTPPVKFKTGNRVWVNCQEPWQGKIVELSKTSAKLLVEQGHQGAGSTRTVLLAELSHVQPACA